MRGSPAAAARNDGFGALLREWREHRRLSQLALACEAGVSQRHVSFLESGRSNPSPGIILRLAEALAVPLRERNVLLRSAGFAERYEEEALDSAGDGTIVHAVEAMLRHHEPYPALALDGRWNMVGSNGAARRFFALFVDLESAIAAIGAPTDYQLARLCLHDAGLKPYIANWSEVIEAMLRRARLALAANPRDRALAAFVEELLEHPDAPDAWRSPDRSKPLEPVLTLDLVRGPDTWRLFSMMAHFGNPGCVTLQELTVELFFPADEATRERLPGTGDAAADAL